MKTITLTDDQFDTSLSLLTRKLNVLQKTRIHFRGVLLDVHTVLEEANQ